MSDKEGHDCPICASVPTGKIYQCKEGHIICETCLRKIQQNAVRNNRLPQCPSCAGPLDNDAISRCRLLENMLERLKIECNPPRLIKDEGHKICWIFGDPTCKFRLSFGNAHTVMDHIKYKHPTTRFLGNRVSCDWDLYENWKEVVDTGNKPKTFYYMLQVPGSQAYVTIIIKVSQHYLSFYSVDLGLGIPKADNVHVTFSIPNETAPLFSWTFVVACGTSSWNFLGDEKFQIPIQIGIKSLFALCDKNGKLKVVVHLTSTSLG